MLDRSICKHCDEYYDGEYKNWFCHLHREKDNTKVVNMYRLVELEATSEIPTNCIYRLEQLLKADQKS
jgi:hypothetical protein